VRGIGRDITAGKLSPERITEKTLAKHLYVTDAPDVDLFVRTSGEQRTSNFLPWQSVYAEMVFLETLWPDMTRVQLWEAIAEYQRRTRRFGGAVDSPAGKDQVAS
jgi:undecaprenyl diphosphate synthase